MRIRKDLSTQSALLDGAALLMITAAGIGVTMLYVETAQTGYTFQHSISRVLYWGAIVIGYLILRR